MELSPEMKEKVSQLQLIEHNLHTFLTQKQNFQSQMMEIENAVSELKEAKGQVYKMTGSIMIASDKSQLEKELAERLDILKLRLETVDKQEKNLKNKAEKLQEEVMKEIEKKEGK